MPQERCLPVTAGATLRAMNDGRDRRFGTTQWTLVLAAGQRGAGGAAALERLCALYWPPIFAYVRRQGHSSAVTPAAVKLCDGLPSP